MTSKTIKAITFDLWDTLIIDDSDEPKRAAMGLAPKPVERRNLVERFLAAHRPIARELVDLAFDTADAAFRQVWYGQNITWTVRERLEVVLGGLGRELPEPELDELVRLLEEMELEVRPDLAPGVSEVLAALQGKYKIGVISDAIFSPGRALRRLLEGFDIAGFFDTFVFSDEAGFAKPTPVVFELAAEGLGVGLGELVHVGDREQKDVDGPKAVGARSIFCTVVKDRGSQDTAADAIIASFEELPAVLDELGRG